MPCLFFEDIRLSSWMALFRSSPVHGLSSSKRSFSCLSLYFLLRFSYFSSAYVCLSLANVSPLCNRIPLHDMHFRNQDEDRHQVAKPRLMWHCPWSPLWIKIIFAQFLERKLGKTRAQATKAVTCSSAARDTWNQVTWSMPKKYAPLPFPSMSVEASLGGYCRGVLSHTIRTIRIAFPSLGGHCQGVLRCGIACQALTAKACWDIE